MYTMSAPILVLNGPNLNMLGTREPHIYGYSTLADVNQYLQTLAIKANMSLEFLQSNAEHVLVDRIQQSLNDDTKFIIINPAAFTHTSVAIRDAFVASKTPFIEVHISNIHAREPFRHHSYLSDLAMGVICGLGVYGYEAALMKAIQYIHQDH